MKKNKNRLELSTFLTLGAVWYVRTILVGGSPYSKIAKIRHVPSNFLIALYILNHLIFLIITDEEVLVIILIFTDEVTEAQK